MQEASAAAKRCAVVGDKLWAVLVCSVAGAGLMAQACSLRGLPS